MSVSTLYRYRPFHSEEDKERAGEIIRGNELYFSCPLDFNDPFDCRPKILLDGSDEDFKKYFREALPRIYPAIPPEEIEPQVSKMIASGRHRELNELLPTWTENLLKKIGVCCFSEVCDDILMWSHYSGGHTGYCLEFLATNSTPFFGEAQKVEYSDEYPIIDYLSVPPKELKRELTVKSLLTKSAHWSYEKEWRIFYPDGAKQDHLFPTEYLTGIILGARMPEEDKQCLIELNRRRKNPCPVMQAELKERKFGLNVVPIA